MGFFNTIVNFLTVERGIKRKDFKFLDLVAIHLKDHGVRVSTQYNSTMLVVHNSFMGKWFGRNSAVYFEVLRFDDKACQVWRYSGAYRHNWLWKTDGSRGGSAPGYEGPLSLSVVSKGKPLVVCETTDPDCLDKILVSAREYFK